MNRASLQKHFEEINLQDGEVMFPGANVLAFRALMILVVNTQPYYDTIY